ncbi:MAG: hypothetical protein DCF16_17545 [Alphaproteobacteria bacterium]|nr:MAG: hypothetical protein DCF16_17545 [Alphaproteobacteria bacterium]
MNWLANNWIWIAFAVAMVAMHLFGHGHGGHRHGGRSNPGADVEAHLDAAPDDREAPADLAKAVQAPVATTPRTESEDKRRHSDHRLGH